MDKATKIISVVTLIITVVFSTTTAILTIQTIDLSNRVFQAEESSRRADISVLINPISHQNWAFESNRTDVNVNGELFNEGKRNSIVTRARVEVVYTFSDGKEWIDAFPSNFITFNMENYTIAPSKGRMFNFSWTAYQTIALNKDTGEVIGVYGTLPDKVRVFIWHIDGLGEQVDFSEITKS